MSSVEMFRQGDILLIRTPDPAHPMKRLATSVVAEGEATGHMHRVVGDDVGLYEDSIGTRWAKSSAPFELVHDEHAPIALEPGFYQIFRQVEYGPDRPRRVVD